MNRKKALSSAALVLAGVIWGMSYVAGRLGINHIGPFTFNGIRACLGGLVLLPAVWLRSRRAQHGAAVPAGPRPTRRTTVLASLLCGLVLVAASNFQLYGMQYTSVGKAGFITSCYILFVPLIGLLMGSRPTLRVWAAIGLAVGGLYLLSMEGGSGFSVNIGDLLVLINALFIALHILIIDHFLARGVDVIKLSCYRFLISGVIGLVLAFLFEQPNLAAIQNAALPLLYSGILSCGVAYTLQNIGQRYVNPTAAALLTSLESCFAAISGWLVLGERMQPREITGCIIVFCAIVLAQLPGRPKPAAQPHKDA